MNIHDGAFFGWKYFNPVQNFYSGTSTKLKHMFQHTLQSLFAYFLDYMILHVSDVICFLLIHTTLIQVHAYSTHSFCIYAGVQIYHAPYRLQSINILHGGISLCSG